MLDAIESRLTAILGEALRERLHLSVVRAPASFADLDADATLLRVALGAVTPEPGFERHTLQLTAAPNPSSRRVLPIRFAAQLQFRARPAAGDPDADAEARARLLDDLALTAHWLGAGDVRSGAAFASAAPDPGFKVLGFGLARAGAASDLEAGLFSAALECEGSGFIWPPVPAAAEGVIGRVDALVVAPLNVRAELNLIPLGGTTRVHIGPLDSRRVDGAGARGPASLAVSVLSDLPLDRRGTVTSGSAGMETGVRIVEAGPAETVITYQAPSGNVGATRTEYVAVHLASADRRSGAFLGSTAVKLEVTAP
jgi:hypothetical protein